MKPYVTTKAFSEVEEARHFNYSMKKQERQALKGMIRQFLKKLLRKELNE